jgi:predicted nuclease with TOPRIM domain
MKIIDETHQTIAKQNAEYIILNKLYEQTSIELENKIDENTKLKSVYDNLNAQYDNLKEAYEDLKESYEDLNNDGFDELVDICGGKVKFTPKSAT